MIAQASLTGSPYLSWHRGQRNRYPALGRPRLPCFSTDNFEDYINWRSRAQYSGRLSRGFVPLAHARRIDIAVFRNDIRFYGKLSFTVRYCWVKNIPSKRRLFSWILSSADHRWLQFRRITEIGRSILCKLSYFIKLSNFVIILLFQFRYSIINKYIQREVFCFHDFQNRSFRLKTRFSDG